MATYVVGDIHGCFTEWITLKRKIEQQDKNAKFILVGDIIDRGPDVIQMLNWAMENIKPGGKYQMVLGNHEDMIIQWANQYYNLEFQIDKSRLSETQYYKEFGTPRYRFDEALNSINAADEYVMKAVDFFKSLPIYLEVEVNTGNRVQHYVVCHAAIPNDMMQPDGKLNTDYKINQHIKMLGYRNLTDYVVWERNYWGNSWKADTIVVHGHTPTCIRDLEVRGAIPGKIDFRNKDINLDCGMCYNDYDCNLAAICLETLDEFYAVEDEEGSYLNDHPNLHGQMYSKDSMLNLIKTGSDELSDLKDDTKVVGE